jgi:SAM-dependent methyltransferase
MEPDLAGLDTTIAHPARMQNYVLGGKDHFAADREAADKRLQVLPAWRTSARESRYFLSRAVRYLAGQEGIRQFLDIGPGLPSAGAAHEVAHLVAPEAKVAYADNDPMVVTHARALLNQGQGICVQADLADPEQVLAAVSGPGGLDLSQPVGLLLLAVLHFIPATAGPRGIVRTLADALAPGSYLVISHLTKDFDPERVSKSMKVGDDVGVRVRSVTRDEFTGYFDGLELVDPGVVLVSDWRRDQPGPPGPPPRPSEINFYGGVARRG